MTRDEKLLFSWRVLQCYYHDAGRILPECQSDSIRVCIQTLPSSDFNIYTQFYNHADSMCFYRESKEWQERTDRSIQHLEMAAEKASQLLFSPYILLYMQRYLHFQGREAAFDAAGAHASLHGFAPAESRRIRNRIADRRKILGSSRSTRSVCLVIRRVPSILRSISCETPPKVTMIPRETPSTGRATNSTQSRDCKIDCDLRFPMLPRFCVSRGAFWRLIF